MLDEPTPTRWRSVPLPSVAAVAELAARAFASAGADMAWPVPPPWFWSCHIERAPRWPVLIGLPLGPVGDIMVRGEIDAPASAWAVLPDVVRRLWALPPAVTGLWLGFVPGEERSAEARTDRLCAMGAPGTARVDLSFEPGGRSSDLAAIATFRSVAEDEATRAKPPKVDWAYSADITLADPTDLVGVVERVMAARGGTALTECSWSVTPPRGAPYPPEMARSLALYEAMVAAQIPATRRGLDISGRTDDLTPLEVCRPLLDPRGEAGILAGALALDEADGFDLWYTSAAEGYCLDVFSEGPLNMAAVQALLPIEFRDIGPEIEARNRGE